MALCFADCINEVLKFLPIRGLAIALTAGVAPASTQTTSCQTLNLTFPPNTPEAGRRVGFSLGGTFETADEFTFSVGNPAGLTALEVNINGLIVCNSPASCQGATYTVQSGGPLNSTFSGTNVAGQSGTLTRICSPASGGTTPTTPGPSSSSSAAVASSSAAAGAASASSGAIGRSVGEALSGLGGARGLGTGVIVSTRGDAGTPIRAWASMQGTNFSGTLDGSGAELTFGADVAATPGLPLGFLVSYGTYDLSFGGVAYDSETVSFGPYLSARLGGATRLDGFLTYGEPDYGSGALRYGADRTSAGLNLSTEFSLSGMAMTGFASVSGYREELGVGAPGGARTVKGSTVALGARVDFQPTAALRPYLSLAAEGNSFEDGLGTDQSSLSPRLGFGIDADLGGGSFGLDVTAGEVFDGARDASGRLTYNIAF